MLPIEGAHQFIDSLAIPKTRSTSSGARFMNYILRPEVSKLISAEFPYTNPNLEARKLLSPEELENPASYPPGNPKLATFRDIGARAGSIDKLFTDLKAKSGAWGPAHATGATHLSVGVTDRQRLQRGPGGWCSRR